MSVSAGAALLIGKGHAIDRAQRDLMNSGRIGVGGLHRHSVGRTGLTDADLELAARFLASDGTVDVLVLAVDHDFRVARSADFLSTPLEHPARAATIIAAPPATTNQRFTAISFVSWPVNSGGPSQAVWCSFDQRSCEWPKNLPPTRLAVQWG
ncbi:hypothetical protein I553_10362 [Mycobacterium xenopi 4042]|uniref:Uncharacterized protein n=1 Tax=Mycobacterium xenopi 4042 TaxID=1299334 RepID=X7ZIM8_MYCXE|nr:hypothetical protein I553_10362 [Mycobacterium xenopi 4042]